MVYCEGINCAKRNLCAYHERFDMKARLNIDYSKYGDHSEGYEHTTEHIWCGDKGQYNKFKPYGYREDNSGYFA